MRGYFGIGVYSPKRNSNIGMLFRSSFCFGASFTFAIKQRYSQSCTDTPKSMRTVPLFYYDNFNQFMISCPINASLIGIQQTDDSMKIKNFCHPEQAIYILGSEDHGLPKEIINVCESIIEIPTRQCLNVAVAGSIVMYDRIIKNENTSSN